MISPLCCFSLHCQLSWVAPNGIIFSDKKTVLQPQRAPTVEGTSGALHGFLCTDHAQILSDCCELVLNADTTSAVDAKIWM